MNQFDRSDLSDPQFFLFLFFLFFPRFIGSQFLDNTTVELFLNICSKFLYLYSFESHKNGTL